jgi:sarcosine oxidase delta subunit
MEYKYESNIKCPYCGWEDQDSWEFDQEEGITECGGCEKEFNVTREIEVTYSTSRIACEDDKHSYKTERQFIKKRKYLGKDEWEALAEQDWEYYRIEVCEICDDKEFISITKDEYECAMAV